MVQIWVLGVIGHADSKYVFKFGLGGLELVLPGVYISGMSLWPSKTWAKSQDFGPRFSGDIEEGRI